MTEVKGKKHSLSEPFYYMNLGALIPIQLADMGVTMTVAMQTPELLSHEMIGVNFAYEHFGIVGIPLLKAVLVPAMIIVAHKLAKDNQAPGWAAAGLTIINIVTAIVTINNAIILAEHLMK